MGFRDKVSGAKDTATNVASGTKETVSEKTDGAKETVSEAKGTASIMSSGAKAIQQYGGKAANVAQETDFRQTYRFGKIGLKYGKRYGDYVPVAGGFLPYIGGAAGVGVGILDATELLSADKVIDFSSSFSDATEQVVQTDTQETVDNLATGGVVFADSYWGEPGEESMKDLLEMDFDEFADKQ
jgi:hypothetical protein